jgi:hypothetical protein
MGLAAAWLCQMSLERWRIAAKAKGGSRYQRTEIIAIRAIIACFFAGLFATFFGLLRWLA